MSKFRNFCFTMNNYTEDSLQAIKDIAQTHCKYWVMGKEVGESGTPHIQGYIEFKNPRSKQSVIKMMQGCHIEVRKGTREQAAEYCKKDGEYDEHEDGFQPQGKRNDLCFFPTMKQAAEEGVSYQAIKMNQLRLEYMEEPRDWKPEVYWYYGETGTGKSRKARWTATQLDRDARVFTKNEGSKWWNGYDAHEVVIIDDFRDSWWSLTEMLRLLDRYEAKVECKGGMRQFKPRIIIVTSAFAPSTLYQSTGECVKQLTRRIDHVEQFTSLNAFIPPVEEQVEAALPQFETASRRVAVTPPLSQILGSPTQILDLPSTPPRPRRLLCLDPLPEEEDWFRPLPKSPGVEPWIISP